MRDAMVAVREAIMAHSTSGIRIIGKKSRKAARTDMSVAASASDVTSLREALRQLVPFGWLAPEAVVSLAGEIRQAGALSDIVAFLAQSGRCGTLIVASDEGVRTLGVERGDLVLASTTVTRERIGELLHETASIPHDDLDVASVLAAIDGRPLGELLVSEGRIDAAALEKLLHRQAEEIFFAITRLERCVFAFVDAPLCAARLATRPSLLGLLLEGARRADEAKAHGDDQGAADEFALNDFDDPAPASSIEEALAAACGDAPTTVAPPQNPDESGAVSALVPKAS